MLLEHIMKIELLTAAFITPRIAKPQDSCPHDPQAPHIGMTRTKSSRCPSFILHKRPFPAPSNPSPGKCWPVPGCLPYTSTGRQYVGTLGPVQWFAARHLGVTGSDEPFLLVPHGSRSQRRSSDPPSRVACSCWTTSGRVTAGCRAERGGSIPQVERIETAKPALFHWSKGCCRCSVPDFRKRGSRLAQTESQSRGIGEWKPGAYIRKMARRRHSSAFPGREQGSDSKPSAQHCPRQFVCCASAL